MQNGQQKTHILEEDVKTLQNVGIKRRPFYVRLMGERIIDALFHLPINIQQRQLINSFSISYADQLVTFEAEVLKHFPSPFPSRPYRITLINSVDQTMELIFFNAQSAYLRRIAKEGQPIWVSGKLEEQKNVGLNKWKIVHPDYIGITPVKEQWIGSERIYSLTAGVNQSMVRSVVKTSLKKIPDMPEWLDGYQLQQKAWPSWQQALEDLHHAQKTADLEIGHLSKQRLVYDELLAYQLSLQLSQTQITQVSAPSLTKTNILIDKLITLLPFKLTSHQLNAFQQISQDLQKPYQTLRLLQGDVGSGKTVVAFLASLQAVEAGYQATILAPTDILSRQHYHNLQALVNSLGVSVSILTAREKGKERQQILNNLSLGIINILVGTHAVIQETVNFKNLGLAIIDEQHRFGVEQRLALSSKGNNPHILSMTATPIPRTLLLSNYGDIEVSTLAEKPPGRQPIVTRVMPLDRLDDVLEALPSAMENNQKIYWVCPLVEESETTDLAAATERHQFLSAKFPDQVTLIHGRMKSQDKEAAMQEFIKGPANILVATTVIEVGVDVPAATIMIIEHAERFGLAQLHQLRGRVGRGPSASSCLLLYGQPLTAIARKRLAVMRESEDGFIIAEADLKLRGGGEILGTRQSGLPKFKFFDLTDKDEQSFEKYEDLLAIANKEAKQILQNDPQLQSERGQALQLLLRFFKHENAFKYRCSV